MLHPLDIQLAVEPRERKSMPVYYGRDGTTLKVLFMTAALAASGINTGANAQQQCEGLLKLQVFTGINNSSSRSATFYFACSHNYHEFGAAYGGSASAEYEGIGGSADYNQSNYEKWQMDHCNSRSTEENRSSFIYYYAKTLGSDSTRAYVDCLRTLQGLTCFPEPTLSNSDNIDFNVNWRDDTGIRAIVQSIDTLGGTIVGGERLKRGDVLRNGSRIIDVKRSTLDQSVALILNVSHGDAERSCLASVAPEPSLPEPVSCPDLTGYWHRENPSPFTIYLQSDGCYITGQGPGHTFAGKLDPDRMKANLKITRTDADQCTTLVDAVLIPIFRGSERGVDKIEIDWTGNDGRCKSLSRDWREKPIYERQRQ